MALHRTLLTSTTRLLRSSPSRAFTDSKYHGKEISRDDESYQSIKNWQVLKLDPRGGSPCFANDHLVPEYTSYDPPRGFTGEQIMQFDGAKDVFESVEEIEKLIELRDQFGTLESKVDS